MTARAVPAHPSVCPTCGSSARVELVGDMFYCLCGRQWPFESASTRKLEPQKGGEDCTRCEGAGYIDDGEPCPHCSGDGREPV